MQWADNVMISMLWRWAGPQAGGAVCQCGAMVGAVQPPGPPQRAAPRHLLQPLQVRSAAHVGRRGQY